MVRFGTTHSSTGHRQRLKERFLVVQEDARSDEALLELLLCYANPQQDLQPLARKLLAEFGTLSALLSANIQALMAIDGIKTPTAVLLKLVDFIRTERHADVSEAATPDGHTADRPAREQLQLFDLDACSGDNVPEAHTSDRMEEVVPRAQTLGDNTPVEQAEPPHPVASTPELAEGLPIDAIDAPVDRRSEDDAPSTSGERFTPHRGTEIFSNALLKEAVDVLPHVPQTQSLDEVRCFLRGTLHFSGQQTRERAASYIARRMFPASRPDRALLAFAQAYAGRQELRDVCFYRFCKAEPLMLSVVEDLLVPSMGSGRIDRRLLRDYLTHHFPASRNVANCAQAIVTALADAGIARTDGKALTFAYREVALPAFTFVLYDEFPEPGMYDIAALGYNQFVRALLWNPDRLLPALYELRNHQIISKVSEIDRVRQFTTKGRLDDVVDRLTAVGSSS